MRTHNDEFFSGEEFRKQTEYKIIRAEQYINVSEVAARAPEAMPSPPETQFGNERPSEPKKKSSELPSTQSGRRRASVKDFLSKITETATSTVGTTVAVIGAAATVAVCGSIYAPAPHVSLISLDVGADCVEYVLALDELQENVDYDIVVSNAYHTFTQTEVTAGENTCFINQLKPFYEYTLSVVGKTEDALGQTVYFEQSFYTGTGAEPKAFIDLMQTEQEVGNTIDYSLYVSDPLSLSNRYLVRAFYENELILEESWTGQTTYEGSIPVSVEGEVLFSVYADINGELRLAGEKTVVATLPEVLPIRNPQFILLEEAALAGTDVFSVPYEIRDLDEQWQLQAATFHVAYNGGEYDIEQSAFLLSKLGAVSVEIPADVTEFTLSAELSALSEDGETWQGVVQPQSYAAPHQVVLAEKEVFDASQYNEGRTLTLRFFTHLPEGTTLSVTDTATGVATEAAYGEYSETLTASEKNFIYQVLDEQGNVFIGEQSCSISFVEDKPTFTLNYTNPGYYLETYNEDGTINLYTDVQFACDDERVHYELVYYSDSVPEQVYRSRDPLVALENLPNEMYYLIYYVVYEQDGVRYVIGYVPVSGNTGHFVESNVSLTAAGSTVELSIYDNVVWQGDVVLTINGTQKISLTASDFVKEEDQYVYSFTADTEIVSATIEMLASSQTQGYETLSGAGFTIHGSIYKQLLLEYTA